MSLAVAYPLSVGSLDYAVARHGVGLPLRNAYHRPLALAYQTPLGDAYSRYLTGCWNAGRAAASD